MPIVPFDDVGSIGVIKDTSAPKLPPGAWTDALNVRPIDGSMAQALGHGELYAGPPVIPFHIMPVYVGSARYWLYAGLGKAYAVSGATGSVVHTDITKAATTYAGAANAWTSTSLSGIPILNAGNTTDLPQRWDLNLSHKCVDLDNWPAATYCKSLRAFKNQLVALNVTKSGTNYPFMVKWSTEAVPGAVPGSWDPTDTTKDAGETDLAEGGDPVVDGLQLGGTFVIYKEHSVWRMDYTGGPFVNAFTKVGGVSGAMNRNCIAAVEIGGVPMHVVLTNDDVIAHNGETANSILDAQARRYLFQAMDSQNTGLSFVFKNPFLNEVFVCYAEGGYSVPNKALVWNYKTKAVWFREIPNLNHAAFGPVEVGASTPFDSDSSPFDSLVRSFNGASFTPDASRVLMASNDQHLFLLDSSATFNGSIPTAYLERQGLHFGKPEQRKTIRTIWPQIAGAAGQQVKISVGVAERSDVSPTYVASSVFTIGTDTKVDVTADGRYIAFKFEGQPGNYGWKLDGYSVDFEMGGFF